MYFVPQGPIFSWQLIGNKSSVTEQEIEFSVVFGTLPCISSLMVRVTFSPPSDWTLMGSMSGLDVKEGAWSRERGVQGPTRVWWWSQPTGHLPDKRDKDTPDEIRDWAACQGCRCEIETLWFISMLYSGGLILILCYQVTKSRTQFLYSENNLFWSRVSG